MLRQLISACFLIGSAASAWAGDSTAVTPEIRSARQEQQPVSRHSANRVSDPQQALDLADAMSDPELLMAAMSMGANPEIWLKAMERAGASNVPKNLAQTLSPDMLADWFFSSIDPQFQQAVLSRMVDPKKPQRGMQAMRDSRFYMPALATLNPATPTQWMKVTADGRVAQTMQPWFDPKACFDWMRLPMPPADKKAGGKAAAPASYGWTPPQRY